MAKQTDPKKLPSGKLKNPKHEIFCRLFSGTHKEFFGNATKCYMQAFGFDERWWAAQEEKSKHAYGSLAYRAQKSIQLGIDKACSVQGNRLLGMVSIQKRCDELLDLVLSDELVDRERGRVIQQNKDFASKIKAIESYDKLKARLKGHEKLEGEIVITWKNSE